MDTVKYSMGEMVYLRVSGDGEGSRGIITGVIFRPDGFKYIVAFQDDERYCYEIELTTEPFALAVS